LLFKKISDGVNITEILKPYLRKSLYKLMFIDLHIIILITFFNKIKGKKDLELAEKLKFFSQSP